MEDGRLKMLAPFAVERIATKDDGLAVEATLGGKPFSLAVDRIVVATGFRPDLSFLGELRVALDPAVEAPPALAPLIDPNFHSCGTVPPHGIEELAHPEPGFVIVGSKSYGRAPTFLMATGYEQVRSVVAEIAGDHAAARAGAAGPAGNRRLQRRPLAGRARRAVAAGRMLRRTGARGGRRLLRAGCRREGRGKGGMRVRQRRVGQQPAGNAKRRMHSPDAKGAGARRSGRWG